MSKVIDKFNRLIKDAVKDEQEAIEFYDGLIMDALKLADESGDADPERAKNFLDIAQQIEYIRNQEIEHYNFLKQVRL